MIDISGMTATEIKSMVSGLNNAFWGSKINLNFLTKLCGVKKTNGLSFTNSPGWAGLDIAQHRAKGAAITERDIFTYKKTITLEAKDASWNFGMDDLAEVEPIGDTVSEVTSKINPLWGDTIHAGFVEFITNNAGQFGVLSSGYSCLGYDAAALYANSHYGGVLDNIAPYTGATPPDVENDFWVAWKQLRAAKIPGTNRYFWAGVALADCQPVIMFPPELEEVMNNVFGAEQYMTMSQGTAYNSPQSNVLADGTVLNKPILIPSPYLTDISTTQWYVFLADMSCSPSEQPVQIVFNPFKSSKGQRGEAIRNGVDVGFGDNGNGLGDLFSLAFLGEGSEVWIRESKAVLASKTNMGFLAHNPYRTIRIG